MKKSSPKKKPVKKTFEVEPEVYPKVYETFYAPRLLMGDLSCLIWSEPTVVNGISIEKYRVTVEKVDEPKEVLIERLRELWMSSLYNSHQTDRFRYWADKLGIELNSGDRASKYIPEYISKK